MTGIRTTIQTVWVRESRVAGTIQSSLPTAHLRSNNTRPGILLSSWLSPFSLESWLWHPSSLLSWLWHPHLFSLVFTMTCSCLQWLSLVSTFLQIISLNCYANESSDPGQSWEQRIKHFCLLNTLKQHNIIVLNTHWINHSRLLEQTWQQSIQSIFTFIVLSQKPYKSKHSSSLLSMNLLSGLNTFS